MEKYMINRENMMMAGLLKWKNILLKLSDLRIQKLRKIFMMLWKELKTR
jgi:hypothetical protein